MRSDLDRGLARPLLSRKAMKLAHAIEASASLEARIARIVAALFRVPAERVRADTAFEDLGADSADLVEIQLAVLEETGVDLPDDVCRHIVTVGDLARCVEHGLAQGAA
jgi:acyl carrier protein